MLVQAFTETNDWGEFLKIKESLAVNTPDDTKHPANRRVEIKKTN